MGANVSSIIRKESTIRTFPKQIKQFPWSGLKKFIRLHYWGLISMIGILFLLAETLEHSLPGFENLWLFYFSEVCLVVLLLVINGFLVRELLASLAEKNRVMDTLRLKHELGVELSASQDLKDLARDLVNFITLIVPAAQVELYLYNYPDRNLYLSFSANVEQPIDRASHLSADKDPCRSCPVRQLGEVQHVCSCERQDGCVLFPNGKDDYCLPLSYGAWPVGLLHIRVEDHAHLTDKQVGFLENLSTEMASAIGIKFQKDERDAKNLAAKVKDIQLDLARDIHDTIGQNISYMRMKLEQLSEMDLQGKVDAGPDLKQVSSLANESYDLVRGTLAVLQSNNLVTLEELLANHVSQVTARTDLDIIIVIQGEPRSSSARQLRQLFYVFREALSNIEKHAHATRVRVEVIWEDSDLKLNIIDNGVGFDLAMTPSEGHYGLRFMRDRIESLKGQFLVRSSVGFGTEITIELPYY